MGQSPLALETNLALFVFFIAPEHIVIRLQAALSKTFWVYYNIVQGLKGKAPQPT